MVQDDPLDNSMPAPTPSALLHSGIGAGHADVGGLTGKSVSR